LRLRVIAGLMVQAELRETSLLHRLICAA